MIGTGRTFGMKKREMKEHKDSGWRCLVCHYDKDGNALPQCVKCSVCHKWISPDKMKEKCEGKKDDKAD